MANNKSLQLSVLDQSPITKGSSARQALAETTQLAQLADRLGYARYWVSEHHNTGSLAGSAPEILIAHLANHTQNIRIGSGGIMLPNHSALKMAENFRLLESLFPGRIDMGIGRAPGTDRITASLLNPSNQFKEQEFVEQLDDLQHYFHDTGVPGTIMERIRAIPQADTIPQQWILSSSGESGLFAAHFGMGLSFAHFINPNGGAEAIHRYRERFQPSDDLTEPRANAAIFVFCHEDETMVQQQQAVMDYRFLQLEKRGELTPVTFEDIKDMSYTAYDMDRITINRRRTIYGTPLQVEERLQRMASDYQIDEIILVTITDNFAIRQQSYRLLAKLFL